jgi:hypothetical protein
MLSKSNSSHNIPIVSEHNKFMNNLYLLNHNDDFEKQYRLTICLKMIENNHLDNIYENNNQIFKELQSGKYNINTINQIYQHFIKYYDYQMSESDLKGLQLNTLKKLKSKL